MGQKAQLSGFVKKIFPEQQVNPTMKKQLIFIETNESKPQQYEVSFWNQKIDLLKGIGNGDSVKIDVFMNGKHWSKEDGREGCYHSFVADQIQKF